MKFKLNITQKFIAYLMFFSIIPLIVVGVVSYTTSANLLRNESENYTRAIVNDQLSYLELQQEQIESLIANVSGVETVRTTLADKTVTADSYTRLSTQAQIGYILNGYLNIKGLASIDIFTTTGIHYSVGDTLVTDEIRTDIRDAIFQETLASEQQVTWIGVVPNVNTNSNYQEVITAAKVIYSFNRETLDQEPVALLLVNYRIDELYNQFSSLNLGEDSYLAVFDSKGRYLYHPNRALIGTTASAVLLGELGASGGTITADVEDESTSISYERSTKSGWVVASFIPTATFDAKASPIQQTVLLVVAIAFVVVIITAFFYNRDLVSPIRQITTQLQSIQSGDLAEQKHLPVHSRDEIGELLQGYNLFLDSLWARQRIEKEREELIEHLREATHLANEGSRLKSEFLATMSHELRTPLNAVIGYSELMLEGISGEVDNEARDMIGRIHQSSQHLLILINDVLDLSKIEAGRLEIRQRPISVAELTDALKRQVRILAEKKSLRFEVNVASDVPPVILADGERLNQVLLNLLSNAIKFTERGTVNLAIIGTEQNICFKVKDTGIGIPTEAQMYIFEEFRQVDGTSKRQHGGTGLGLAIVRRLVAAMNGTIELKSEVGKGSEFIVQLPLLLPALEKAKGL